jgi:hypothetical protein
VVLAEEKQIDQQNRTEYRNEPTKWSTDFWQGAKLVQWQKIYSFQQMILELDTYMEEN